MVKFALIGTGRIGQMHAHNIVLNPRCKLEYVYDANLKQAKRIAKQFSCKVANSSKEAISNPNIDAVFIASSTATHIDYILAASKENKPVLCEKPIDLDIKRINASKK